MLSFGPSSSSSKSRLSKAASAAALASDAFWLPPPPPCCLAFICAFNSFLLSFGASSSSSSKADTSILTGAFFAAFAFFLAACLASFALIGSSSSASNVSSASSAAALALFFFFLANKTVAYSRSVVCCRRCSCVACSSCSCCDHLLTVGAVKATFDGRNDQGTKASLRGSVTSNNDNAAIRSDDGIMLCPQRCRQSVGCSPSSRWHSTAFQNVWCFVSFLVVLSRLLLVQGALVAFYLLSSCWVRLFVVVVVVLLSLVLTHPVPVLPLFACRR